MKGVLGFAIVIVAVIYFMAVAGLIPIISETFDDARDTTSLNCQGTDSFSQVAFDNDTNNSIRKLTRRPTCFFTGLGMVYFVGAFIIALLIWVTVQWGRISK